MKALVRNSSKPGDVILKEVEEVRPQNNQVKIRVKYAGICGSDIKMLQDVIGPNHKISPPIILGHEGSGEVVEIGNQVESIKVGDLVYSETTFSVCGKCRYCAIAQYNHCIERKGLGSKADGFFAEYVIAPETSVHKIPQGMSLKSAALMEPLSCAVRAVIEKGKAKPYENIVIIGPGTIGLCAAQVAKACGSNVILIGTRNSDHRLDLAKKLGIKDTLFYDQEDLKYIIYQKTDNVGADKVIDCVGSKSSLQQAYELIRKDGTIVAAASYGKSLDFNFEKLFRNEIKLIGSRSTVPSSWRIAERLVCENKINLEALITHVLPLEEWQKGFELTRNSTGLKVLLSPEIISDD